MLLGFGKSVRSKIAQNYPIEFGPGIIRERGFTLLYVLGGLLHDVEF